MFWKEENARLNWIVRFIAFFPKEATHATRVDQSKYDIQMIVKNIKTLVGDDEGHISENKIPLE